MDALEMFEFLKNLSSEDFETFYRNVDLNDRFKIDNFFSKLLKHGNKAEKETLRILSAIATVKCYMSLAKNMGDQWLDVINWTECYQIHLSRLDDKFLTFGGHGASPYYDPIRVVHQDLIDLIPKQFSDNVSIMKCLFSDYFIPVICLFGLTTEQSLLVFNHIVENSRESHALLINKDMIFFKPENVGSRFYFSRHVYQSFAQMLHCFQHFEEIRIAYYKGRYYTTSYSMVESASSCHVLVNDKVEKTNSLNVVVTKSPNDESLLTTDILEFSMDNEYGFFVVMNMTLSEKIDNIEFHVPIKNLLQYQEDPIAFCERFYSIKKDLIAFLIDEMPSFTIRDLCRWFGADAGKLFLLYHNNRLLDERERITEDVIDFVMPFVKKRMEVIYSAFERTMTTLLKPYVQPEKIKCGKINKELKKSIQIGLTWEKVRLLWLMNKKPTKFFLPREVIFLIEKCHVLTEIQFLKSLIKVKDNHHITITRKITF